MKRSSVTLRSLLSDPGRSRRGRRIKAQFTNPQTDPRYLDYWDRQIEGLRKAGLPEE